MAQQPPQDCIPPERLQQVQQFVQRIGDLNNRIGAERQANEAFRDAIRQRISSLQEKLVQIAPRIDGLNQQILALTGQRDQSLQERDQARNELQGFQGQLQQLTQERDAAAAQVAQITQQMADSQAQSQQLQQDLQTAQQALNACEAKMANCTQQINALLAQLDQIDAAITANDVSITQLHDTAGASYQEIQQALQQLEADLNAALAAAPAPAPANPNLPPPPGPGGAGVEEPGEDEFHDALQGPIPPESRVQMGPRQMPLAQAIAQLNQKNNQVKGRNPNNKYAQVLQRVHAAQNVDEVNAALSNGGLAFNQEGLLKGGKTRKNRKGKSKRRKNTRKGKKAKKTQRGGYRAVYPRRYSRKTTSSA